MSKSLYLGFLEKMLAFPLWIKQSIFLDLSKDLSKPAPITFTISDISWLAKILSTAVLRGEIITGTQVDPPQSRGAYEKEAGGSQKETGRGYAAGFEDGGKGHEPRDLGACGSWKRRETDS